MKLKKFGAIALSAMLMMAMAAGCSSESDSGNGSATGVSGTVKMAGSTSMQKYVEALGEAFHEEYPDAKVDAQFNGSGEGIAAVSEGKVDIGNSSRALKDEEKSGGVVENVVATDGIAIVVNKDNPVTDLTTDQLEQIYTGKITNWKDVGGDDEAIVVVGREASSGTRGAFEELLGHADDGAIKYANEQTSTGAVVGSVQSAVGAIGYVSLDGLDEGKVSAVKLDGVEATAENIAAGDYALSRPFVMATKGEISEQSELVQTFFEFVSSDKGIEIAESKGLVPNTK